MMGVKQWLEKHEAEQRAERDSGKRCRNCKRWNGSPPGHLWTCWECERFASHEDSVSSSGCVRCPHCKRVKTVEDMEAYHVYQEGEHELTCMSCDKEFTVTSHVSYSIESPAIGKTGRDEEES